MIFDVSSLSDAEKLFINSNSDAEMVFQIEYRNRICLLFSMVARIINNSKKK